MWMALAYQAAGDNDACIETYKFVEDNHPLLKVRNQAANLRFICQAPKLKRGPDEMVQIPVLKIEDRKKCVPGPPVVSCSNLRHAQSDSRTRAQ